METFIFVVVRKVLVYIILSLAISSGAPINQIFKIKFLFQHFHQHQQRNGALSLMDFLEMHYWGEDIPDQDDEQDNQLPFKKPVFSCPYVFFNPLRQVRLVPPVAYHRPAYGLPRIYNLPEAYLHALFKPPRAGHFA